METAFIPPWYVFSLYFRIPPLARLSLDKMSPPSGPSSAVARWSFTIGIASAHKNVTPQTLALNKMSLAWHDLHEAVTHAVASSQ